jgi:phospho-N-acetylmuramoyl-pentapeptide-transferase
VFYHILYPLRDVIPVFNVFRYITFRTAYAFITAFFISLILGPIIIKKLKKYHIGQNIRADVPENHFTKAGTPTMGGLLIIVSLFIPIFFWADLTNKYIWLVVIATLGFGLIGFYDDYIKVVLGESLGLRARYKFPAQIVVGLVVTYLLTFHIADPKIATRLVIPFFKELLPDLHWFYIPLGMLVIIGTSNAVNLTDGLDGLAIGPVVFAMMAYTVFVYLTGNIKFAHYLNIPYVEGVGELAIFCGAVMGAGLGFLWFNSYPAQMFMGDVGSLALGGALGTLALASKQELILLVVAGIFVIEALSVIIQVISFKLTGKRVFRMAPLHHHFEKKGWEEPKIIVRFWIISIILVMLSLSTLKLR